MEGSQGSNLRIVVPEAGKRNGWKRHKLEVLLDVLLQEASTTPGVLVGKGRMIMCTNTASVA